jgi:hypothetical protein
MWWFLRTQRNPTGTVQEESEAEGGGEAADPFTQRDRLLFAWREPGRLGDCLGVS